MRFIQSHVMFSSLVTICLCFPFGTAMNFNFTPIIPQNPNITVDHGAYISTQGIQLTSDERTVNRQITAGRALYNEKLHLWDKPSRNLTDFNTYFSFIIDSEGSKFFADGLVFFLFPSDNYTVMSGGTMGLPIDTLSYDATSPFVAIEFDTAHNAWDSYVTPHVGIDINSIKSNVSTKWDTNISSGIKNEAWISYDSKSQNLSVVFTGYTNNIRFKKSLSLLVDLRLYLPEWVRIGFSGSTGGHFEKNNIISWQFNSSLHIVEKTPKVNATMNPVAGKKRGGNATGLIVGLTLGLSILVVGLVFVGLFLWKRKNLERGGASFSIELSMEEDFESGRGPKRFSYIELSRATNNFNEEQKLGQGGFGGVYRGFLKELNSYVAVKRISKGSTQGIKEYGAEVKIISRLRHRNLVQLIGWCHETKDLLLIYEYMENSSLDTHLFKGKSLLTWETRLKIAKGLASALLYLHEEWEKCVIHRDIKSSNVMLDQNFNTKLGDFGLARLVDHEKGNQTTILAGTMGYMAPECVVMGKASKESDVYSFGVVALEIACGRKPIDTSVQDNQVNLVEFVWNSYGNGDLLEAVDPKLGMDFDQEEMERLMVVGLWCAHPNHNVRPSIRQAIHVLDRDASLPLLPRRMPVATYFDLPVNSSLSMILANHITVSESSQTKSSDYTSSSSSSYPSTSHAQIEIG